MESAPTGQLATVAEAAQHLRISVKGLYARIRRGTMPGVVKVGRSYRIDLRVLTPGVVGGGNRTVRRRQT